MKYVLLLLLLVPAVSAAYITPSWTETNCRNSTSIDEFYACAANQRILMDYRLAEFYNYTNGSEIRLHLSPQNEPWFPIGKISGDINESAVGYAPIEGPVYMGHAWPCNDGAQLEKYAEGGYWRYECYQTRTLSYAQNGQWGITQNAYLLK